MGSAFDHAGEFARDVQQGKGEGERRDLGVGLVVELVAGCDHASVTQIGPDGPETVATTSEVASGCDQLQFELNEGPCVDTIRSQQDAISNALASDRRWPRWGPSAAERYGVGSMLSLLLYTHGDSYGALTLYSNRTEAYDHDDLVIAHGLAAHLAVAVADGRSIDHRELAIIGRTVIGQAEGILMNRYRVSATQAFDLLREASQNTNRRLSRIAEELVRTGEWEQVSRRRKA